MTTTTTEEEESSSNKKKGENNSGARACFLFIYVNFRLLQWLS